MTRATTIKSKHKKQLHLLLNMSTDNTSTVPERSDAVCQKQKETGDLPADNKQGKETPKRKRGEHDECAGRAEGANEPLPKKTKVVIDLTLSDSEPTEEEDDTASSSSQDQDSASKKQKLQKDNEAVAYRRSNRFAGGSFHDVCVTVGGLQLKKAYGEPGNGDGCKSYGSMSFEDKKGNLFSVYDMRAGYNPWQSNKLHSFHIGCFYDQIEAAQRFSKWLEKSLGTPEAKEMNDSDDIAFMYYLYDNNSEVRKMVQPQLKAKWQRLMNSKELRGKKQFDFNFKTARAIYGKRCEVDKAYRDLMIRVCNTDYEIYRRQKP